jgi:tetratricopeptide (TPR) repeat protein
LTSRPLEEARQLAQQGDVAGAITLLKGCPSTPEVLEQLAFYLSQQGEYKAALEALEEFRAQRPEDGRGHYMTGYQYYKQKRFREAATWFQQSIDLDPKHLKSHFALLNSLAKLGLKREACQPANAILAIWHDLPPSQRTDLTVYARACYLLGKQSLGSRPDSAVEYFQAASDAEPDDAWHHWALGRALVAVGQAEPAVKAFERAASLKPDDKWIELGLAGAAARSGDLERARVLLYRNRNRVRSWEAERAGQVAKRLGDHQLAVEFFTRAAADPGSRGNPRIARQLLDARNAAGLPEVDDSPRWGRVHVVRADGGFGFLVDELDGSRRHFRLPRSRTLAVNDRVRFSPLEREKGPAAELIEDDPDGNRRADDKDRADRAIAPAASAERYRSRRTHFQPRTPTAGRHNRSARGLPTDRT